MDELGFISFASVSLKLLLRHPCTARSRRRRYDCRPIQAFDVSIKSNLKTNISESLHIWCHPFYCA